MHGHRTSHAGTGSGSHVAFKVYCSPGDRNDLCAVVVLLTVLFGGPALALNLECQQFRKLEGVAFVCEPGTAHLLRQMPPCQIFGTASLWPLRGSEVHGGGTARPIFGLQGRRRQSQRSLAVGHDFAKSDRHAFHQQFHDVRHMSVLAERSQPVDATLYLKWKRWSVR
jgi:hypothetical protein